MLFAWAPATKWDAVSPEHYLGLVIREAGLKTIGGALQNSVSCRPPEYWRHLCAGWRDVVACFDIRHVRHSFTISSLPSAPSMIPD